jgi:peptidoglycan/LPS O-acetylase OafA/YrhL
MHAVDGLRGLMALAVVIYHMTVWTRAGGEPLRTLSIVAGIYSVQGFFVISGLCFFKLYGRTRWDGPALRAFYLRRWLRIAPLFYCALALTYLAGTTVDPHAGLRRLTENVTLTFALFHPNHSQVLGGWSIGIECLFYAVFPALAWLTRRRALLYVLLLSAAGWALRYTFGAVEAAPQPAQFHVYVALGNHAFLFLLGGAIADLSERGAPRIPAWFAALSSVALCFVCVRSQAEISDHVSAMVSWTRVEYVSLCAALVSIWALAQPTKLGLGQPLVWLGDLSYSIYLMHPLAWFVTQRVLPTTATPALQLATGLATTLAIAVCTERCIERPAIALGRRLTVPPDRTVATPAACQG